MDRVIMFIASGAYTGYLPKAPGTWGSMVGVALWLLLARIEPVPYAIVVGAIFLVGTACAGSAEKIVDRGDPGIVVIDEIVGQLIALAGFALFRFFDILKPFPVNWLDKHIHGGLGIMLDDVIAGLYAFLVLQVTWRYLLP